MAKDLTLLSAPRISVHQFTRVLDKYHSPALIEADALYATCLSYKLDPAVALAFFVHESTCGTQGKARETRNWGNIRVGQGRQEKNANGWAWYRTWNDGLADWCQLINRLYIVRWSLTTVAQMVPRYAPRSDGNAPTAYIKTVLALVNGWQAQDVDVPEQDGQLIQTYRLRSSLSSAVIVRASPSRGASQVGTMHAGEPFTGFQVPGTLVSYPDLGESSIWLSNVAGTKFVWFGLFDH
jgi:hypothetical protein